MPNAAEQSPNDMAPPVTRAPAPSDLAATPDRPLPHPPAPERGFLDAVNNGTRTLTGEPGSDYWQQEAEYDLDVRILPEENRLEGTAVIRYTNNAPTSLKRLYVELAQNLHAPGVRRLVRSEVTGGVQVDAVRLNGAALADGGSGPRYRVQNTLMRIDPPNALPSGEQATLEIDYHFTIPQAGASGRMGYSDDLFFLAYFYPAMAVYDDVTGWMTDDFLGRAEFYAGFADFSLSVQAPEDWVVQATGALQNPDAVLTDDAHARLTRAVSSDTPVRILEPGQQGTRDADSDSLTWRFSASQVRDVAVSLTRNGYWEAARTAAGDRDGDGTVDSTAIHTFWRESAPKWSEVTTYQQHAISFLSEYTGLPYPWPHMTAVEGGGIIGGGMEFPMMTLMGDYNNNSARMLYAVTAHELAHMWIPMIVSTNERRYAWIDEGTTSFNENMARTDYFAESSAVASDRQDYVAAATRGVTGKMMRWSDTHRSATAYGIASYRKPATVLVALHGLLGEATFNRALQDFVTTWAYKHPYPSDLFNTFERVAGRDLDWFWSSWYYTTWTMDQSIDAVTGMQQQTNVTVKDLGTVPMPARLTATLTNGETLEREIPVDVWLRGRTTATATFNVPRAQIQRIELDAAHDFPDVNRQNDVWTRDE